MNDDQIIEKCIERSKDGLESAQVIYEHGYYSGTVSLIYFSMYHMVQAIIIRKDGETTLKKYPSSKKVIREFEKIIESQKLNKTLVDCILTTKTQREMADYTAHDQITKKIAEQKIRQNEAFINESIRIIEQLNT